VADKIVVMNKGQVEQVGSPRDVYERPATPFVFDFLGQANRLEGEVKNQQLFFAQDQLILPSHYHRQTLNQNSNELNITNIDKTLTPNSEAPTLDIDTTVSKVIVFARPTELHIHIDQPAQPAIQATVLREVWLAGRIHIELKD
ncbi:hypothetical protein RJJ65_38110, partial [Rhizobium hidalgonense]|nr:hypothetical protein [Rhizobium hidalgonense]